MLMLLLLMLLLLLLLLLLLVLKCRRAFAPFSASPAACSLSQTTTAASEKLACPESYASA